MGTIGRTDVELVQASLRGEHEAFGHLVARYQDVVCAVSYSSTGDRGLSEDVAQETFIAAWSQLDRLRDTLRLRPWLCGIARNLGRKARKRKRREELTDGDDHVADGNPFDDAAREQVARVVREALARIPEGCREVLVLYYREDQSIREIAETLGTSEVAVMQRLSRGRRYLADSITELVERSLRGERRRRDLVAAVLASIAAISIPSRVDASPLKGSTMMKLALAASAVAVVGTVTYFGVTAKAPKSQGTPPALHFGGGKLGLAHAPALGPTAAPRQIQSRSVAQSDLALLPADSDAVIGFNFAQVRQSTLWQRFVAPQLAQDDGIREFTTLCGFDPLASLGSVSLGLKGLGSNGSMSGTIVIHGFDKTKAMTCFDQHGVADAEKEGTKVTIDGGVVLISHPDQQAGFTFVDDTTAVIVLGPEAATKEGVLRVAAGGGTLATSSAFAETLSYVNTDD
jgi:RNA polymerase sigma factor (sigma-70 family)